MGQESLVSADQRKVQSLTDNINNDEPAFHTIFALVHEIRHMSSRLFARECGNFDVVGTS